MVQIVAVYEVLKDAAKRAK